MELVISIALGAWISLGGWLAYKSLKKEFELNNIPADKGGVKK